MGMLENFEAMLAQGKDNALLRYTLGSEYLKLGRSAEACLHLAEALRQNPAYSAAWKLLGRAQAENGDLASAAQTYAQGIAAAEAHGDIQASKEMRVFARRVLKQLDDLPPPDK